MRLHTKLSSFEVREALEAATSKGQVDRMVGFYILERRGSRSRDHAFEVQLEWLGTKEKGDGRRWKNSGNRGAESYDNGSGTYAATYDEWGWFINELFNRDSELIFGHYKDRETFDSMTRFKFC